MIDTQIRLTGDMTEGLDKLGQKVETDVLFSGAAAMARVFYDEVKVNASRHVKTGTMYDAVYRVYAEALSKPDRVVYHISINNRKAPHWRLLEYGTSRMPAYPVLRPAWDSAKAAGDAGVARMAERMSEVTP